MNLATLPPPEAAGRLRRLPRSDAVAALKADPTFFAAMKAEWTRLSGKRGPKLLTECCAISKMNHAALTDILKQAETPHE